ncbi:glycosyltransferase WbpH [Polaromonas eurypsychrophila]|uniref:Glycosyltransferase WbpH n=2 Tax=Polaromonas eurypsychrophila TaxID=1614635 RepID=A0A916SE06_9BURK|nr:glycosyltransferase WbpH [Polaromonas eurypsychrophila]
MVHLSTAHPRDDTRIFIKQVHTLSAALAENVSLVVADGLGDSRQPNQPGIFDLGKLPASRFKRAVVGNFRALMFFWRNRPQLVHFHDPELIPLGLLLRLRGSQVIYDVHEDVPRQTMSKHWIPVIFRWPVAMAIAAMEWLGGKTFNGIVPATPTIAARFPVGKTVLVQNFPIQSELVLADPLPYAERPQKFAYVGGISDIRGGREMVQALEHMDDLPEVRLEMAGGITPEGFAAELAKLPGWFKVHHRGTIGRQDVARLLGSARAGLVLFQPMPNHVDAQPNKMFEYMSAGLPVIASDFPLWRQIVAGARCGLLVDPLDPRAIAQALRWVLEHPVEAEVMGRNGQEAVHKIYNWEKEATQLVGLYKKLLSA